MTTAPKSADDIRGYEFDWLARDADDHVGFFSTAGAVGTTASESGSAGSANVESFMN